MFRSTVTLALLLPIGALAAPLELAHQGRLLDSTGLPMEGPADLTVSLYDDAGSATPEWTDTFSVELSDGYYAIRLGKGAEPLTVDLFSDDTLWVGIAVDGAPELSDRIPLASAPWAIHADTATNVSGGVVNASEVQIDGQTVLDADGLATSVAWADLEGTPDAVNDLADALCDSDEGVLFWNGNNWACGGASEHAHSADQITEGTLSYDVLPVGTSGQTVAAGAHTHSAEDVVGGILSINVIPVGTDSDSVAAGAHTHSADDITDGVLADARLPANALPNLACSEGEVVRMGSNGWTCATLSAADVGAVPTATNCSSSTVGAIRYDDTDKGMQWCDGSDWTTFTRLPIGQLPSMPGSSCKAVLDNNPSLPSGTYWIDPNNTGAFEASCDMEYDGGGWTILSQCDAQDLYGAQLTAQESTSTSGIDGSCRPYTRDRADAHTYSYDIPFGSGFAEFRLVNWSARANAGGGYTSDWGGSGTSNWSTSYNDVAFGSADDSGPVTSFVANGQSGSSQSSVYSWPGNDTPYSITNDPGETFRIIWGEAGGQYEGWYPWWAGELWLR